MLIKKIVPAALILFSASSFAVDENADKTCTEKQFDLASIYTMSRASASDNFGTIYKNRITEIEEFAKKNQLKEFKILSQDLSIGQGCCGSFESDVTISVMFQYIADYSMIDKIRTDLKVPQLSISRNIVKECK